MNTSMGIIEESEPLRIQHRPNKVSICIGSYGEASPARIKVSIRWKKKLAKLSSLIIQS